MLSKLRNKKVAGWAATALVATGFAVLPVAPAMANTGTVEMAAAEGSNYGAFSTDSFDLQLAINSPLAVGELAYAITVGDDVETLNIELRNDTVSVADTSYKQATIIGFNALGQQVDLDGLDDAAHNSDASDDEAQIVLDTSGPSSFVFDFDTLYVGQTVKTIHVYALTNTNDTNANTVRTPSISITALDADGSTALGYGDGSPGDVSVSAWIETEATPDYTTVDSNGATRTVSFYDPELVTALPSVTRFVTANDTFIGNDTGQGTLGAQIRFTQSDINLDMMNLSNWNFKVGEPDDLATHLAQTNLTNEVLRKGFKNHDAYGAFTMNIGSLLNNSNALASSRTYIVSVQSTGAAGTDAYPSSAAYAPPVNSVTAPEVRALVSETTAVNQVDANDTDFAARAGVNTLTFTAQIQTASDTAVKKPSVLVAAVVRAGGYLTPDAQITVTGATEQIDAKNRAVIASGFTNANGEYVLKVTHSAATKADSYSVEFFVLDGANDQFIAPIGEYSVAYDASNAETLKADRDVLGGESVTVDFSLTDQFDQPTNQFNGKAANLYLKGSDVLKLEEKVAFDADGSASVSFDNYVEAGAADLLSAWVYSGATPGNSGTVTETLTLYNAAAASAVQVPEEIEGAITYSDFIADGAKVTTLNPAPTNAIVISGTIADSNGSGVPGAAVTISAPGMQIQEANASKYYQDELSVTASAAGVFTVNLYAHIVNTDGQDVTFTTPSGIVGTTSVVTYLPENDVTGKVLKLDVAMPSEIVVNTTYAVTATLSDKWGNPVSTTGTDAASFSGSGSIEVNGVTTPITKDFDKNGEALVYVRSVKDIPGPGSFELDLDSAATYTAWDSSAGETAQESINFDENSKDDLTTAWDETLFANSFNVVVDVKESASAATSTDTKVNAGSFKGYVALYAKGYEGQRMSAIVAGKWLQVDSLASNFERIVRFTGAGYDINIRIYIDGKQVGEEFNILTK